MRASRRLALVALVGIVGGLIAAPVAAWPIAALVGWDVAALAFSVQAWTVMVRSGPETTAALATQEDPGRTQSDLIVVVAAVASLVAVGAVLARASSAKGSLQDQLVGLGVASVAVSWFAVHTLFALRYARLYYTGPDGGIDFNQADPPRYLDFAYVAFTIGMTFQVSDTDLRTPQMRTTALVQALIGYLFGAVILAATVNLIASLASSG